MSLPTPNKALFSHADLTALFGADNCGAGCEGVGVVTDSRSVVHGNIFVALRGDNFDGHQYVAQAFENGATCAVVEHSFAWDSNDKLVRANDSLNALATLACYHRCRFNIPIIAIAGSAGKTSTKDVTAHVLGSVMNVLSTEANFNNRVGLPLTLLQLTAEHECAVIEAGTNHPGEMETLMATMLPTHGLITNIGKEHLEFFNDLDGVEREETVLFEYLDERGGVAFVNMDDARLSGWASRLKRVITFGLNHDADLRGTPATGPGNKSVLHVVQGEFTFRAVLNAPGRVSAINALAASAVAWALSMTAHEVRAALQRHAAVTDSAYGRMHIEMHNGITFINDCYNANPLSMEAALETLAEYSGRRIAVLGDMGELGDATAAEHLNILNKALGIASFVCTVGQHFRNVPTQASASSLRRYATIKEAAAEIKILVAEGDTLLVKGSRSMAMETLFESFK